MDPFPAHTRSDPDGTVTVQTVSEHCRKTAAYAAQALKPVSLSACGYLAGLVHDAGKYTEQFRRYLCEGIGPRGSVNHTFAAVRLLLARFRAHAEELGDFADITSELLALAAGGHHGLFDCVDKQQKNGLQYRLEKEGIGCEEALQNFFQCCADPEELEGRFQEARAELTPVLEHICTMTGEEASAERYEQETAFYSGLLARLLLSAVIEGDRRDTAAFINGTPFPAERDGAALEKLWGEHLEQMERKLALLPQDSPIDRARRAISDQCRQAAELRTAALQTAKLQTAPGGVFRLNVPTGGGKTLSSLRFALTYACRNRKQRIIFTSPLISILEQNADVIRDYIQDDSLILEHHSNLTETKEGEELDRRELLTETWEAPIIITTLVQLLNTLFSGKTTAIRRFHALCGSVIVIDEVQTVPSKMLTLFSLAVNFLAEICGAAVVLCSATQPCMERIAHPLHLSEEPDLVPYDPDLWAVFRRTEIRNKGTLSLEQIVLLAEEQLQTADSLLIVCNKKGEAQKLFKELEGGDYELFELSAAMCPAHRQNTLDRLRKVLAQKGRKAVCVSTQVIEAGVDISFACVIRLSAGMDSVIQAAGRCNRSGEAGPGVLAPVYLVQCQNETLDKLPDIQKGIKATEELLKEFENHPERYSHRLDSDEAIGYYYRTLYRHDDEERSGHHDYIYKKGAPSLFSLLSLNKGNGKEQPYYFRQAFKEAGTLFQVFEEDTTDVIVPYGRGTELIADLCSEKAKRDPAYLKERLKAAKPYTISLYQYQLKRLSEELALIPLQGGAFGLNGHYSEQIGFTEKTESDFLEE